MQWSHGGYWPKVAVVDGDRRDRWGCKTGPTGRNLTGTHALSRLLSRDTKRGPKCDGAGDGQGHARCIEAIGLAPICAGTRLGCRFPSHVGCA
jgi:hypothetical protein